MHTLNDVPTQYWKDGELVDYTEQERQELLQKWNEDAERIEIHASLQYQRDRAGKYPPIGDQLDALFKAGAFPAEMAALIQAVKDKYPKGQV